MGSVVLGIDPGVSCGVVAYDTEGRGVTYTDTLDIHGALEVLSYRGVGMVAIERVQSYGIPGRSLLETSESVGRLWQAALMEGLPVRLVYRREVLRALDVTGKGNRDSLVRARLLEMHGGTRKAAQGVKANPGPLYRVKGHEWAALAVAIAASLGAGEER